MPIKTQTHNGDGSSRAGQTFEHTVRDPVSGELIEDAVITCRVLTKAEARAYRDAHTTRVADPASHRMVPLVDEQGVADAMCADIVTAWRGVHGADDQPLVCTPETVAALDDRIRVQIVAAVFGVEVTGRGPETFRAPAAIPALVARSG
jgi:hypothetical protein